MANITIEPATADRFDDAQHALTGGGDGAAANASGGRSPTPSSSRPRSDERRELLRDEIAAGPPPALIAYVDGEAAGLGPRRPAHPPGRASAAPRTSPRTHRRAVGRRLGLGGDAASSCASEHRGEGLNARLLDAAVDFARENGARVIEAYPIDPRRGQEEVVERPVPRRRLDVRERRASAKSRARSPTVAIVALDLDGSSVDARSERIRRPCDDESLPRSIEEDHAAALDRIRPLRRRLARARRRPRARRRRGRRAHEARCSCRSLALAVVLGRPRIAAGARAYTLLFAAIALSWLGDGAGTFFPCAPDRADDAALLRPRAPLLHLAVLARARGAPRSRSGRPSTRCGGSSCSPSSGRTSARCSSRSRCTGSCSAAPRSRHPAAIRSSRGAARSSSPPTRSSPSGSSCPTRCPTGRARSSCSRTASARDSSPPASSSPSACARRRARHSETAGADGR